VHVPRLCLKDSRSRTEPVAFLLPDWNFPVTLPLPVLTSGPNKVSDPENVPSALMR